MDTKEKITRNLKGKQAFVLNLSDGMNERIIKNAREKIDILLASKEKIMPTYNEKRKFFEEVQREYLEIKAQVDNVDDEVSKQQQLIETFVMFNKTKATDKHLQINAAPLGKTQPHFRIKLNWIDEFADSLEKADTFLPFDELFKLVIAKPHIIEACKTQKGYQGKAEYASSMTRAALTSHALHTANNDSKSNAFKPRVTIYNELFGLPHWCDEKNVPKPKYIKPFMYGNGKLKAVS